MTTWKSVGKSHYGELRGVEQFMQVNAANRILALIDVIARQPGCRRITVNEGRRTRVRQMNLWTAWQVYLRRGTPWAALAAPPYTSRHDEVNHGNAADLGGPNGEALNAAELRAIDHFGPALGVTHTGLLFRPVETWHVEAATTSFAYVAPASPSKPKPVPVAPKPPAINTSTNRDDMYAFQIIAKSSGSALPVGAKFILDVRDKVVRRVDTGAKITAAQRTTLRDEWNTILTGQTDRKPISWTASNAEAYKHGGYTTAGTW